MAIGNTQLEREQEKAFGEKASVCFGVKCVIVELFVQ